MKTNIKKPTKNFLVFLFFSFFFHEGSTVKKAAIEMRFARHSSNESVVSKNNVTLWSEDPEFKEVILIFPT